MRPFGPPPEPEPLTAAFWKACREGRLEMPRCTRCDWWIHPPRPICPLCRGRDIEPGVLSGAGRVHSYTVNWQPWYPDQAVPYVIALVELCEQAGLRLVSNLVDCPIEEVRIGMPVRAVFVPVGDEVGLPLFRPDTGRP